MQEDLLYTPEELASILKLSRYTVYEMIKHGDIPAYHVGRSIRISQSQLEIYLMSTKQTENIYEAIIVDDGDSKYAQIKDVRICVLSELEGTVKVMIRPEDIILSSGTFVSSARNVMKGVVTQIVVDNRSAKVFLDVGISLCALITKRSLDEMDIKNGDVLYAIFKTMSVKVIKQ